MAVTRALLPGRALHEPLLVEALERAVGGHLRQRRIERLKQKYPKSQYTRKAVELEERLKK